MSGVVSGDAEDGPGPLGDAPAGPENRYPTRHATPSHAGPSRPAGSAWPVRVSPAEPRPVPATRQSVSLAICCQTTLTRHCGRHHCHPQLTPPPPSSLATAAHSSTLQWDTRPRPRQSLRLSLSASIPVAIRRKPRQAEMKVGTHSALWRGRLLTRAGAFIVRPRGVYGRRYEWPEDLECPVRHERMVSSRKDAAARQIWLRGRARPRRPRRKGRRPLGARERIQR